MAIETDDIIRRIQEEIDKGNINTLDEINAFAGKLMDKHNNTPMEHAEGLSPNQLNHLLWRLFTNGTLITLNPEISDELALTSPFLRICIHILKAIPEDKPLKLTATGALPRWLVQEVYHTRVYPSTHIDSGFVSLLKEMDWFLIHLARLICELAGVARQGKGKDKCKWFLTRKGKKLLTRPGEMLELLFTTFYLKFAWSYLDFYESETAAQTGFGFSLFLLNKYGSEPKGVEFYANKFHTAFPMVLESFKSGWYVTAEESFASCYSHRTFYRFLQPMGMVETKSYGKKFTSEFREEVAVTPLFTAFIKVDPEACKQEEYQNMTSKPEPPVPSERNSSSGSAMSDPLSFFGSSFDPDIAAGKIPGRNDPCPCGSGRKYKKCCLH